MTDEDFFEDVANVVTDLPATFVTFMLLLIIFMIFMGYYGFQESACMAMAKEAHMPYSEYTLSKGCIVGQTPPQLEQK